MDSKEFRSEQFQCVYEYLKRHASNMPVDRFTYIHNPESVAENPVESLRLYLKYVRTIVILYDCSALVTVV